MSNLPQAQVQILPSKELEVLYPKPTIKERLFSKNNRGGTIVSIFSLLIATTLTVLNIYENAAIIAFAVAASQLPFIIKVQGIQKIIFEKKGLIITNFDKKVRKYNFENDYSVDFVVKTIGEYLTLSIDEHTIYLEDAKQLPMVIEQIATLWDLEYHETKQVNQAEVLTYQKKGIQ